MRGFVGLVLALLLSALAGCSTCGPGNCSGCCDSAGACQAAAPAHCGQGGGTCQTCLAVQQCVVGVCQFAGGGGGSGSGSGSGSSTSSSSSSGGGSSGGSSGGGTSGASSSSGGSSGSTSSSSGVPVFSDTLNGSAAFAFTRVMAFDPSGYIDWGDGGYGSNFTSLEVWFLDGAHSCQELLTASVTSPLQELHLHLTGVGWSPISDGTYRQGDGPDGGFTLWGYRSDQDTSWNETLVLNSSPELTMTVFLSQTAVSGQFSGGAWTGDGGATETLSGSFYAPVCYPNTP